MRKNKIRILHVAQAAGGVDRYIRMLLKYLDKEKFENILVCSQDFHEEDYRDLVDSFEQVEMTRAIGGNDLKAIKEVRTLIKKYNPDIVYTQCYKEAILFAASELKLSKASVTSYLPYEKGVYFPSTTSTEKISVGAERQRRYRATKKLRAAPTEEHLWEVILMYQKVRFKTYSGLPFYYEIRKGRSGGYTKELWIDRRENSKSLAWSSVLLALGNVKEAGALVDRPKALGDIRGVTYIYGMFYRFGLIDVPDEAKQKMKKSGCASNG